MMSTEILNLDNLQVVFPHPSGKLFFAVNGVSFTLKKGETLGIVGESGSGKTMIALSLLGLVPKPGEIIGGCISLMGESITNMSEVNLQKIRGNRIGMVFQDPMTSLNPLRRVGSILIESVRRHNQIGRAEARARCLQALKDVGIPSPEQRLEAYPHELSGGLMQRVMIALAIINHPALIVADEPTTALDATIQAQILDLLRERLSDAAMVMISHDLGVAAELCNRIAVMYNGHIVEMGCTADLLNNPLHPYSAGLLAAVPHFTIRRQRLVSIPGSPPSPNDKIVGCAFSSRCPKSTEVCKQQPLLEATSGRAVACWFPQ